MDQVTGFLWLIGIAIVMLYVWIICASSLNGRSTLVWLILSFIISPWLVAILLALAGESNTQKELRELKKSVNPEDTYQIEYKRDKEKYVLIAVGVITLALHLICIIMLFNGLTHTI